MNAPIGRGWQADHRGGFSRPSEHGGIEIWPMPKSWSHATSTVSTPQIVTVERDGDTFVVLADGVPVLTLPRGKALWLNARLAERLAERVALPDGNLFTG